MSPLAPSEDLVIEVESAVPATFVAINDMTAFSKSKTNDVAKVRVFMRALPHALAKAAEYGITMSGLLNTDDAGQARIRAQEAAGLTVNLRVKPITGGGGYTQVCLVSTLGHTGGADDPFQEWSVEFIPTEEPVISGAGPIV